MTAARIRHALSLLDGLTDVRVRMEGETLVVELDARDYAEEFPQGAWLSLAPHDVRFVAVDGRGREVTP